MKKILLFVFVSAFARSSSIAQGDTTTRYYAANGKETTKDSAVSYMKFFRQAGIWHGMEYDLKRNMLKSEGDYNDTYRKTAVGSESHYNDEGKLDYTVDYAEGTPLSKTYFYKSGERKSYTVYGDKGIETQMGWDENGKEIKNFVVEREAQFKGGEEGWKNYLKKNLNETIPAALGLAAGNYEVRIQFTVNTDGIPINIKALSVPARCKACGSEALRMLKESPAWEPAILNNKPVIFETTKTIAFQPVEGVKKG